MSDAHVEHLFVYGTLRSGSGHPMHEVLAGAAEKVGTATVTGRLYRVDWYPGLVVGDATETVHGDLWWLHERTILGTLDEYEGDEYERRLVQTQRADGQPTPAFVYAFTASVDGLDPIASGDWLAQA